MSNKRSVFKSRARSTEYVSDWSPVSARRYELAQETEVDYWTLQDPLVLSLHAQAYFYAGDYEWTKNGALLNPFGVQSDRPQNFQLLGSAVEGKSLLDIGCGPMPQTLSLVHCAQVHVVDPLVSFYREIQPFGWEFFASVSEDGAEELSFVDGSFDYVHCWNVLDHTQDAARILREMTRVLRPGGELLLACDARDDRGGGSAHPYKWSIDTLEEGVFRFFEPVTAATLIDHASRSPVSREHSHGRITRWICRLRKKTEPRVG